MVVSEGIAGSLQIQLQVINALVRRELHTRHSRSRLGILLALVEPLLLIVSFYYLRVMFGARSMDAGMPLPVILITGYLSHYGLRNAATGVAGATQQTSQLLMYPQLTILDSILARSVMIWFTYTTVMLIISLGAVIFWGVPAPHDLAVLLVGLFAAMWFGVAVGVVFGVIERFIPSFKYFAGAILRANMYLAGAMYTAGEIPNGLLYYLRWHPGLHIVEIMREAWSASYHSPAANPWFVLVSLIILTGFALSIERATRHFKFT